MGVRTTGLAKRANKHQRRASSLEQKSLNEIEDERVLKLFKQAGLVKKEQSELMNLVDYADEVLKRLKN